MTCVKHLTEEQINEYLLFDTTSADCSRHLDACVLCCEEVSRFRDSVYAFNRASIAWSEAQPEVSLRGRVREQPIRSLTYPLRWALACTALLAVGLPLVQREAHRNSPSGQMASLSAMTDSPAQIREDDQLMQSVEVALADNDPSPVAEYGLDATINVHSRLRPQERSR